MPDILRGWTTTGLRGLAALLFGVGALLFPIAPVINLVALFGVYALIDGALALAAARAGVGGLALKGFLVGEGLVGIGVGLLAFLLSPLWSIALPRLVAAWVIVTGVLRLGEAARRRHDWPSAWLLLAGLASLPVSYLLIVTPIQDELAQALIRLIGAYAVGLGVIFLVVADRLHEPQNRHAE
jgi:uncharacterized membrane protein HdeD (DUF308 family)